MIPRQIGPVFLLAVLGILTTALLVPSFALADASRVIEVDVPAPALADNLLGTPTIQGAAIYLPPGYDREIDRRYPVAYLLHGVFDDYGVWLENYEIQSLLDRLIEAGDMPELVSVMPNGGNRYGGGYYRNSPVSGRWADFIADDLVDFVDTNYRTQAGEGGRAVVGHSMGGYGALHLAMSRPGVFSVVWALSPCCLAASEDLSFGNDAWKRAAQVTTPEDLQILFDKADYYPVTALGLITAFSPDTDNPPIFVDLPFDIVRGEVVLDDAAYDRYLDALPIRQVHDARDALRNLRGLAIGVGLGDQFLHIPTGALAFSQRLGAERIPHLLDVYAGDHRQQVAERLENLILPWVGERLAPTE